MYTLVVDTCFLPLAVVAFEMFIIITQVWPKSGQDRLRQPLNAANG